MESKFDVVDFLMRLEGDEEMTDEEIVRGYQYLIDSGTIGSLQGSHQRMAMHLIDAGKCKRPELPNVNYG